MHGMKTKIGALGTRGTAVAVLFGVASLFQTGRGDVGRAVGVQMGWEWKLARQEGLVQAIETLAAYHPGQWNAKTNAIVSRWAGTEGLVVTSTFLVPNHKILKVESGGITLLHSDTKLDGSAGGAGVWFLPGAWTKAVTAYAARMGNGPPQHEVLSPQVDAALDPQLRC